MGDTIFWLMRQNEYLWSKGLTVLPKGTPTKNLIGSGKFPAQNF